jgi:hypothetical protein
MQWMKGVKQMQLDWTRLAKASVVGVINVGLWCVSTQASYDHTCILLLIVINVGLWCVSTQASYDHTCILLLIVINVGTVVRVYTSLI